VNESRVSVIIPVFGTDPALAMCLTGLAGQSIGCDRFEVLVVQNGPLTSRPESAAGLDLRWLHEPLVGSYRARNRALEVARHPVLAFIDADCVPEPDWLEQGLRGIARGVDIVAGKVRLTYRDPARLTAVEVYERFNAFRQERNAAKGFSVTANMIVRRELFSRVGPFFGELLSGGDVEWGQRAVAAGARLEYSPHTVVTHPARSSLRDMVRKTRRVTGGTYAREREEHSLPVALGRMLWGSVRTPVAFAVHVLRARDRQIRLRDRVGAIAVRTFLQGITVVEVVRLVAGAGREHR
jgi:GT2 family glycosyltransferase